jgi:polysaccharide chain length determinant protein (PEP-CTERM system associated)
VARDPKVEQAQTDLNDLRLRYTENHPDVVSAKKRLEGLRAQFDAQTAADAAKAADNRAAEKGAQGKPAAGPRAVRSLPNPIYEQIKVRLYETESGIASLQRQIADATRERDRLEEMARSAPGVQAEFLNLNRDYDVLRKNYEELLARRESMRISTAAEADADKIKIQVIDPPQVPQNPVAPKRTLLTTVVLAVGIGAGLAAAVMLVQFDQSYHTIDELRDLGLPVAGGISLLNVTVTRGRLASVMVFSLSVLLLGGVFGALLYRISRTPGGL